MNNAGWKSDHVNLRRLRGNFHPGTCMRIYSALIIHALILLAISLPYVVNLGTSSIWDASEAFYAETPREMLETGNYLAPHFNYSPRTQKPPLAYWIIASSYHLFGISEFGVRLPGALAAIGVILFSYAIARRLFTPRAALLAAIITATSARIFILARRLPIDIYLLFFLMGTLYFLVRALQIRDKCAWIGIYLFAALGFLTKGPVAVIIPAASLLLWMVFSRKPRIAGLHFIPGSLVFLAVALPWYLLIFRSHGWTYIAPFFLRDNLGRFAADSFGPSRGLFYYLGVGAADFFPWSLLALCAGFILWRCRRDVRPLNSLEFGVPILWCALTFILFSLSKNKQEYYIAPIYPVAAVLIAGVLDAMFEKTAAASNRFRDASPSWYVWTFGIQELILFAFSLSSFYIFRLLMPDASYKLHGFGALTLLAGCLLFLWGILRKNLKQCFSFLTVLLWIMYMVCVSIYLPGLEQYRPVKRLCRLIETNLGTEAEAGYFQTALPSMTFYLKRRIFEENTLDGMKRRLRSENRILCILSRRAYDSLMADKVEGMHILARYPRFSVRMDALLNTRHAQEEELLLISNRPNTKMMSAGDRAAL